MSMTFKDILERLRQLDELTLLELLDITSEEIVYNFKDEIQDRFDDLSEYFEEEETDEYDE